MDNLLQIKNITAQVEEKVIIDNVSLSVDSGEILAIMGPNGSGKSSLAQIIMGNSSYEVSSGEILLEGRNITELSPDERSKLGIFLAFQYPVEIPGVPLFAFLKLMYETHKNEKLSVFRFRQILKEKMKFLGIDEKFISRNLNEGFFWRREEKNRNIANVTN
jgi:Fe-S cluster assembly ATP-binding protein